MTNAERILAELDQRLEASVDLTLYGRAALSLGFESPPAEFAQSMDVDAVLALGQALLSKLMRDDPHDRADALFIARRAGITVDDLPGLLKQTLGNPRIVNEVVR